VSPKVKAERMNLAAAASAGLQVYARAEKFIGATDVPGLTKDLRQSRITILEGVIALARTDDWPSYQKAVTAIDRQLARTDPDRMLGAGATVLEHMGKATTFVIKSVQLMGIGMKSILVARGMLQEAAVMGKSLEGVAKLSKALAVVNVLHGAMVLLDDTASGSKKIGAGLEFTSGVVGVTAAGAEAVGATATAAAAGTAATVLGGAAITYESYKAIAEYGYTSVVGGLSYAAIDEELEGTPIVTSAGRGRARGGLEPLGRQLSVHRTRIESLEKQLAGARPDDREGVARALDDEVRRLQNAAYDLAKRWAASPQPVLRARMPIVDELAWQNAMSPGSEPWLVVEVASQLEQALIKAFVDKDVIADETMHETMKRR
jgi:hypothetical protein